MLDMGLQSPVKEANLNLPSSMLLAFLSGYLCSERQWLVADASGGRFFRGLCSGLCWQQTSVVLDSNGDSGGGGSDDDGSDDYNSDGRAQPAPNPVHHRRCRLAVFVGGENTTNRST